MARHISRGIESRRTIKLLRAKYSFTHQFDGFYTINTEVPDAAIAYDEYAVLDFYAECGLVIDSD